MSNKPIKCGTCGKLLEDIEHCAACKDAFCWECLEAAGNAITVMLCKACYVNDNPHQ